jgi:hypothetical protein
MPRNIKLFIICIPLIVLIQSCIKWPWDNDIEFTNPSAFQLATASTPFMGRERHTCIVFENKLWVIGGVGSGNSPWLGDVWCSEDGQAWQLVTDSAGFEARSDHSSVLFNHKMWIIGGFDGGQSGGSGWFGDVWYSENGEQWSNVTPKAAFSQRAGHVSVVFNDKIWVIGGNSTPTNFKNDVWYSSDGKNWHLATNSASFHPRSDHSAVVFDGKIWIIGGAWTDENSHFLSDVWYSENGSEWFRATDNAGFHERLGLGATVFDHRIWIMCGFYQPSYYKNDVWYSNDGVLWTDCSEISSFNERRYPGLIVLNKTMWLIGGANGNEHFNDVWYSR